MFAMACTAMSTFVFMGESGDSEASLMTLLCCRVEYCAAAGASHWHTTALQSTSRSMSQQRRR